MGKEEDEEEEAKAEPETRKPFFGAKKETAEEKRARRSAGLKAAREAKAGKGSKKQEEAKAEPKTRKPFFGAEKETAEEKRARRSAGLKAARKAKAGKGSKAEDSNKNSNSNSNSRSPKTRLPRQDAKVGKTSKADIAKPTADKDNSKDNKVEKKEEEEPAATGGEEEEKEQAPAAKPKSEKCVPIDGRKFEGCPDIKFFAQNYNGFEQSKVIEAFHKLYSNLLPMVKTFISDIPQGCFPTIKTEMCGMIFPSCSGDCQERKACTSSCKRIHSECGMLINSISTVQPGGALEGFVRGTFKDPKVYEVVQTMLTNLNCNGNNLSADTNQCATVLSNGDSCKAVADSKPVNKQLFKTHEPMKLRVSDAEAKQAKAKEAEEKPLVRRVFRL